ncbi:MAG: hypothetical protein IT348_11205 [Candidatus Eisenbacteria bacterium]|nr:hypothetical protein [Candidatus Eisenbacteria bacterium]
MAILALPQHTEVVEQRPVPAIVERFLDRRGSGWNLSNVSTVLPAPSVPKGEEELVLEHMQLRPTGVGSVLAQVEIGEPLRFRSRPGDFDFDPGDE